LLNKYKRRVKSDKSMFNKRKTALQQSNITRSFVTIPCDFIKKLRWVKGEELFVELKKDEIIISKRR